VDGSADEWPALQAGTQHAPAARDRTVTRLLAVIPAYNEAASLAAVVADLRASRTDLDILVVDDGSTDGTASLLDRIDVRWMRFPERIGIGTAMRAGLRYAERLGYDVVVRLDGDGQHRAGDVARLLRPIEERRADVVLGSRFTESAREGAGVVGLAQQLLARCLSALVGHSVTDPTSGFWAMGPRAVRLLAEHLPTGYPEPELRLFLSRNALSVVEVPVDAWPRLHGRTSLTPRHLAAAAARVALAMIVVPLRDRVPGARR
jgi:glycosyltransferase involved in cell wall biosynthesis